jgi:AcrR family transcriptional regulator
MAEGHSPSGDAPPPPAGETAAIAARDQIIDAALRLIALEGWRRLSLGAVAAEAGLPIVEIYRAFGSRSAILSAFFRRIDEAVLAVPLDHEADERPRDRVFDLLMRRFDALQPYRGALAVLGRELPSDPCAALAIGARLLRSMRWVLEAAGISTAGLGGAFTVRLAAAAYLATLRVWRRDETPDLAPTMAELDRRLRGIERWFARGGRRPPRAAAAAAASSSV